jgi:hypothetical protein
MVDPTRLPARANPLVGNALRTRDDIQRAVLDLYRPLGPYTSPGGARVALGSQGAVFAARVAELEGFARPLYGLVPLAVGGGDTSAWERIAEGLAAGTDPNGPEYWGPVPSDSDQRMVEQAAVGLSLAFLPNETWDRLDNTARRHLAGWLLGVFEHDPVPNNWQFFRVLVALGLERVGVAFDQSKLNESLDLIESYRRGPHWYQDGLIANIDYYVPWAFHTYGLMYVAANRLGLGDDRRAAGFAERAAGFADDFVHWFGPDGAAVPYGRSLTYRFAAGSFWGALAWADVESVPWGVAKGMWLRHLRWWSDKPISDRDGVLSIGYSYDNRRLAESYNSAGSPYWCMKFFTGLAADGDHPFWTIDEEPQPIIAGPVVLSDAGWVVNRDAREAILVPARRSPPFTFMEQTAAKYDKLVYSSASGFAGDCEPGFGEPITDSTIAVIDRDGERRVRTGVADTGIDGDRVWGVWTPFPDVRIVTVATADLPWQWRVHVVDTRRPIVIEETGFAVRVEPTPLTRRTVSEDDHAVVTAQGDDAVSVLADVSGGRTAQVRPLPVNAHLLWTHARCPTLVADLGIGRHTLVSAIWSGSGGVDTPPVPLDSSNDLIELAQRVVDDASTGRSL